MKKLSTLLTILCLIFTACGGGQGASKPSPTGAATYTPVPIVTPQPTATPEPVYTQTDKTGRYTVEYTRNSRGKIRDIYIKDTQSGGETLRYASGIFQVYEMGDYIFSIGSYGGQPNVIAPTDYYALRIYKNRITDLFLFSQTKFPQLRELTAYVTEEKLKISTDMSVLELYDEDEGIKTTIDFNNYTSDFEKYTTPNDPYHKRFENFEAIVIYTGWFRPYDKWVYVYDWDKDTMREIGFFEATDLYETKTNMEIGFTPDGRLFVVRDYMCAEYDPATGQKLFNLTDNFKVDYNPLSNTSRKLLSVRRDPVDATYLVYYVEKPHTNPATPADRSRWMYKIAYLDRCGNLVREYDIPLDREYGNREIDLIGTHTVRIYDMNEYYGYYLTVDLDLQTGRFTVVEETYTQWCEMMKEYNDK